MRRTNRKDCDHLMITQGEMSDPPESRTDISPAPSSIVPPISSTVRVHLWIETDQGILFGCGRAQLLQKIEETGSLKKAAESLGISYRAAWGKIKTSEAALGIPLIVHPRSKKEGCQLTPQAKALKDQYMRWFEEVEAFAVQKAEQIFPWSVTSYPECRK